MARVKYTAKKLKDGWAVVTSGPVVIVREIKEVEARALATALNKEQT